MVFESVAAMTMSEDYEHELESKKGLKRFIGSITGSNKRLQDKINRSRAAAQYVSQQTLQRLAEQNLMSFELITAVNNKLNASMVAIEGEINQIYSALVTFFKQSKSDMIQLSQRLDKLERNVNLLNWQNSIEYQMFNGVDYADLDDASKIVCLVRDFYDITEGEWKTSDLLLLKTAMATIDLSPKGTVCYQQFVKEIASNPVLLNKLFEGFDLTGIEDYPEYVALSAGIRKSNLLDTSEKYLVDNTVSLMRRYGCNISEDEVKDEMVAQYEASQGQFDLISRVNTFDFIMEILYNFKQVQGIAFTNSVNSQLVKAEELFWKYRFDNAAVILEEIANKTYSSRANFLLALIYERGCSMVPVDFDKAKELFEANIAYGDILSKAYTMCKPFYLSISMKEIYLDNDLWHFDSDGLQSMLNLLNDVYDKGDELVDYIYAKLKIIWVRFSAKYYDYKTDEGKIEPYMAKLLQISENGNRVAQLEYAEQKFVSGYYDDAWKVFADLERYNIARVHYFIGEYNAWGYGNHVEYGHQSDETKLSRCIGAMEGDLYATLNTAFNQSDSSKRKSIIDDNWSKVRDSARTLDIIGFYEYGDLAKNGEGPSKDFEYAKWLYQLGANAGSWKCRKKLENWN